jgi:hypothetical protein
MRSKCRDKFKSTCGLFSAPVRAPRMPHAPGLRAGGAWGGNVIKLVEKQFP